jgi:hypothetical protein
MRLSALFVTAGTPLGQRAAVPWEKRVFTNTRKRLLCWKESLWQSRSPLLRIHVWTRF